MELGDRNQIQWEVHDIMRATIAFGFGELACLLEFSMSLMSYTTKMLKVIGYHCSYRRVSSYFLDYFYAQLSPLIILDLNFFCLFGLVVLYLVVCYLSSWPALILHYK